MFVQRSDVERSNLYNRFLYVGVHFDRVGGEKKNLLRHWQSWFLVQIPHTVNTETVRVAFYLFNCHHTAVERILLAWILLSNVKLRTRTTNINL